MKQASISKVFLVVVFFVSLFLVFNRHSKSTFNNYHSVNWADAAGYYVYLPAAFIYSFDAAKFPGNITEVTGEGFVLEKEKNKVVTKYNFGVALLQAPFFLAAHFLAPTLGFPQDGYNKLYYYSVMFAAVIYLTLGLFFLIKILRKHFNIVVTLISVFTIYTATNLYYFTINSSGFSHVYSFFLFALFIYLTNQFYNHPSIKKILLLGFVFGLITVIRPTNAIIFLCFLFADLSFLKTQFIDRVYFWRQNIKHLILLFLISGICWLPQLAYWKYISGSYFHYSYTDEGFNWLEPKIINVLFSPNNGWLLYSPVFLLLIPAFIIMVKKNVVNWPVILTMLIIVIYITASWWNWWFGCSYGARNFVEYYAFLIFPITYLIAKSFIRTKTTFLMLIFVIGCIVFNLNTIYHYDDCFYGSTWDWSEYFKIISK